MDKNTTPLFRLVGAVIGGAILYYAVMLVIVPVSLLLSSNSLPIPTTPTWGVGAAITAAFVGALWGAVRMPQTVRNIRVGLTSLEADELAGIVIGTIVGLIAGALAAIPLRLLPAPLGQFIPPALMVILAYVGASTFGKRPHDLSEWVRSVRPAPILGSGMMVDGNGQANGNGSSGPSQDVLLDTSVIIDGRITDISKTGFINATLVVPNFVLTELQHIADSPDPIRRKRGRRGLEVLDVLRNDCPMPFEISDMDVSEVREVDAKLVALARHTGSPIMTNDYNLNRVAGLQGVNVLNINDLANAVKAAHLPGEELVTKVIQEGREHGQGVGYLDDGTMVVIEDGIYHMNETMRVVVTKVLQTSAGRMIFARMP